MNFTYPIEYPEWESNPHSLEHEFESCASTSSAIRAKILRVRKYPFLLTEKRKTKKI